MHHWGVNVLFVSFPSLWLCLDELREPFRSLFFFPGWPLPNVWLVVHLQGVMVWLVLVWFFVLTAMLDYVAVI